MADIDQIIAGGAGSSSRADFSGLSGIADAYWKGKDERAKNDLRDAFKAGVPLGPDGQPDFGAMAKTLFQKGGLSEGTAASNLDIQRSQLKLGQEVSDKMGRLESGSAAPLSQPIISPSASRPNGTPDPAYRPASVGGQTAPQPGPQPVEPQGGGPRGDQPGSIVGLVSAAGIPDELAGPVIQQVSALTKSDPNATLNPDVAARVQQVVQAAAQRMKGGQPQQPTALAPQPQQSPQAVPQAPPVNPQQNQGTFGAPPATPTRGAVPTGTDPEIQKQIATFLAISSNPAYPKSVQEAALARLKALQEAGQPTPDIKNYDLYRRQGGNLPFNEWQADTESRKTAATEEAKLGATKYQSLVENGTKAQMEIPQLELLQEQMKDPNFFSGIGEKYNLAYKRLKSAVGIDPEAAVPQEYLRKATAANVLSSLGALKGLGQIRVAEINMAREAAASPENSVPANKLLVEISKRTHQRNADIAEMAQNYKEKNGTLDAGFDKSVTAYYKKNPLFTDGEIKDWHKVIGEQKQAPAGASSFANQKFASPDAARAAGAKAGDIVTDASGKQWRLK